jgi:hypothetical protein
MKEEQQKSWEDTDNSKIRACFIPSFDYGWCKGSSFEFQIFKRPYFWGFIGKKRWITILNSHYYDIGYDFCLTLI